MPCAVTGVCCGRDRALPLTRHDPHTCELRCAAHEQAVLTSSGLTGWALLAGRHTTSTHQSKTRESLQELGPLPLEHKCLLVQPCHCAAVFGLSQCNKARMCDDIQADDTLDKNAMQSCSCSLSCNQPTCWPNRVPSNPLPLATPANLSQRNFAPQQPELCPHMQVPGLHYCLTEARSEASLHASTGTQAATQPDNNGTCQNRVKMEGTIGKTMGLVRIE